MKYLLLAVFLCGVAQAGQSFDAEVKEVQGHWTRLYYRLQVTDPRFSERGIYHSQLTEFITQHDALIRKAAAALPDYDQYADARKTILERNGEKVPTFEQALQVVKLHTDGFGTAQGERIHWRSGCWYTKDEDSTTASPSPILPPDLQKEFNVKTVEELSELARKLKNAATLFRDRTKKLEAQLSEVQK